MSRILAFGKAPDEMTSAEVKNIVLFATIAAGMSTTQPGGISSIPELVEVLKRMD